jgi:hypothetical protein
MENKLEVGSEGEASFKYEKHGFKGGITAHGIVKYFDNDIVLFVDYDKIPYLVKRDKFQFKKH